MAKESTYKIKNYYEMVFLSMILRLVKLNIQILKF